jgi:hypothetical protein
MSICDSSRHNENLAFTVYRKPGQQLKYLNKDSTHPPHVFRVIPLAVLLRLANLTSYDGTNKHHKTMKDLHPDHCDALEKANLTSNQAKSKSPTLHYYMKQHIDLTHSAKELKKQKDNARNRGVYFCIGFSAFWPRPLHLVLKALKRGTAYDG